ncbi:MAG: flippase [Chloroflexi bacterium]|nr:flippase [Chloroflexota bacterium]
MNDSSLSAQATDSQIVVSNSLIMLVRRLMLWLMSAVLILFLPKYLGAEGLGQLAFATSTAALFITLLTLGVGRFLIKEIARNNAVISTYLGSAIALRAIMSLVVLAAIIIISQFVSDSELSRRVMWIAAATIVVNSFMGLGNSVLNGLENLKWPATVEVLSKLIVVVAGVTVLVQGFGVIGYALVLLGAAAFGLTLNLIYVPRRVSVGLRLEVSQIKTLVVGGLPFILMGVLLSIYNHTDTVILRLFTDDSVVGWYAAANQIYGTIDMLPMVFTAALLPTLSRVYATDGRAAIAMAQKSLAVVAIAIIPISFGVSLFSGVIIERLPYPAEFQNSVPLLTILALTIPATAFLVIIGTVAIAIDRHKAWTYGLLATVSLNVLLNIVFAPIFQERYGNGGIGVAITTFMTEVLMVAIGLWIMPKGLIDRSLIVLFLKVAGSGGLMVIAILGFRIVGLGEILQMVLGGAVYVLLVLVTRAVTSNDLRMIRSVVAQKTRRGDPSASAGPNGGRNG